MSGRAKQTVTKTRKRKYGGNTGYEQCRVCHGTGRQRTPKRKK